MTAIMPSKGGSPRSRRNRPRGRGASDAARVAPLSQTAEYALRAMAYLATQPPDTPARAADLAESTCIPVHYLSKVMRRLVSKGLLHSQKGHGGGFVLARPASEIRFADVLAAVGQAPSADRCAFGWGECDSSNPCPLHPAWSKLNDAVISWAQETTLADAGEMPEWIYPPKP